MNGKGVYWSWSPQWPMVNTIMNNKWCPGIRNGDGTYGHNWESHGLCVSGVWSYDDWNHAQNHLRLWDGSRFAGERKRRLDRAE